MKEVFNISSLIVKSIKGEISESEKETLNDWLNQSEANRKQYAESRDTGRQLDKLEFYSKVNEDRIWEAINDKTQSSSTSRIQIFLRYAASILLPLILLGSLTYYLLDNQSQPLSALDKSVKPGTTRAILKLSNGHEIELNPSVQQNPNLEEEGAIIDLSNNKIAYLNQDSNKQQVKTIYNELITPKGGYYQLKLSDGSKVWLNANSSLKYPIAFNDTIRKVILTGEAYFDVSHNGKPFIVSSEQSEIRVLGTEFNVTAYQEETKLSTTLVEGKVSVTSLKSQFNTILTPGLQSIIDRSTEEITVKEVNTKQFTSWKDGKLEFVNQELDLVMKRLARWYDFKYEFENEQARNYRFTGRLDNDQAISSILEMLELTTDVEFKIKEHTIVIL